jgi:alpha-1,2-mannosyltransferase
MRALVDPALSPERRLPAPLWWSAVSLGMLLCAFAAFSVWAGVWTGIYLEDFHSYVATGWAVRADAPLYEPGVSSLPTIGGTFKYTPFAAGLFVGLTLIPPLLLSMLALLANLFALLLVIWIVLGRLGYAADYGRVAATSALTAVSLGLQPVLLNFTAGQVNLILMLLVLADLTGRKRRWSGVGVGLAAGIKLIPGIFVVYLLVTRQFRTAAVAVGAFAATVAAGFVALPGDSLAFWRANVADPSRITGETDAAQSENQSTRGAMARLTDMADVPATIWIPVALVVAVAALWVAARAHRQGRDLLAVSVVGLTMVLMTPWVWTHYWVWFIPFFVMGTSTALRSRTWIPAAVVAVAYLLMFSWRVGPSDRGPNLPLVGLVRLPETFPVLAQAAAHELYVATAFALVAIAAVRPAWLDPGTNGRGCDRYSATASGERA